MRKLFIILLSALSLTTLAQQPAWYNDAQRLADYPAGKYFTGFSEGSRQGNERPEVTRKRIEDLARAEAAATIRVHVENTTDINGMSKTLETMEGTFYRSIEEFSSRTTTTVSMEVLGLQVESWQNPSTGTIAAFAWVKKTKLIKLLEQTITVNLTKIGTALDQIDQLVASGQKMQARDIALKTMPLFGEVDAAQKLLAAVDEDADDESLQLQLTRTLQHRLTAVVAQLKNGINIYLNCTANMFGSNYDDLSSAIQGDLSPLGCSFVSSASQADWAITVTAPARQYNKADFGEYSSYFAYVDATVIITKTATGQCIHKSVISEKGGHTMNYEQAAREAYRTIVPKISALIKQQIQ